MKRSLLNLFLIVLALALFSSCKKTNNSNGSGTVSFVNNDSVQFFLPPKSMYNDPAQISFNSIVIDNNNNKWMNTSSAIFRFDGVNWTLYNSGNMPVDITKYSVSGLFIDGRGTIYTYLLPYIGDNTVSPTLLEFKDDSWQSFPLPFYPYGLAADKWTDHVYFITATDTVFKFNGSGSFSDPASYSTIILDGYSYSFINNISVSHDSVLVFFYQNDQGISSSNNSGFFRITGNGVATAYSYPNSKAGLLLNGIFGSDGKSTYMLGYQEQGGLNGDNDSLYVQEGSNWNTIPVILSPLTNQWLDNLKYSNDGVLWISYGWNGLSSYKNQLFSFHDLSDSKPYFHISDFAFDSDNVKWLACWEGLIRYTVQ
jgi:hypothetical protein